MRGEGFLNVRGNASRTKFALCLWKYFSLPTEKIFPAWEHEVYLLQSMSLLTAKLAFEKYIAYIFHISHQTSYIRHLLAISRFVLIAKVIKIIGFSSFFLKLSTNYEDFSQKHVQCANFFVSLPCLQPVDVDAH